MSNIMLELDKKRYRGERIPNFQIWYRRSQKYKNPLVRKICRVMFRVCREKRHIELDAQTQIGAGLYFGHAYCITINAEAELGNNINLHKGATIGQEKSWTEKRNPGYWQ